jgi:hypothetical protein
MTSARCTVARNAGLFRVWRTAGALAIVVLLVAHVGTNDVFYSGDAGPWNVRVSIRQPGVIPGLADIGVRVEDPGVERVTVTARATREGAGEAPPPDEAEPVRGETGLFSAQLWLMVRGPHEVIVEVDGAQGVGVAHIPILAAATQQLDMAQGLQIFVLVGSLFLVLGLLTIVGAASRESILPAGAQPAPADRRRGWRATGIAAVVLALALFGGWTWARAVSDAHLASLDKPWASEATMRAGVLELAITEPFWVNRDDEAWLSRNNRYRRSDLIPDHGKMMHMFVVRDGDLDAFAHLHPERLDANRFAVTLPPLPDGMYRVYADITHEDGLSHTLVTTVDAGPLGSRTAPMGGPAVDFDDGWWTAASEPGTGGEADATLSGDEPGSAAMSRLSDGSVMRWLNAGDALLAGTDADLVFRVEDTGGDGVVLDPYMGMHGHAMLNRIDGGVFVHLHPAGTISMAAQSTLGAAGGGVSGMGAEMDWSDTADSIDGSDGSIRFPLVVPEAGPYRIWVQVRRGDSVLTGSFDTEIVP